MPQSQNTENINEAKDNTSFIEITEQMSIYEKIKAASENILKEKNKNDSKNTMGSNEIFLSAKSKYPEHFPEEFSKNTFYQYLSNTVKDLDSKINCLGRRQGYYLTSALSEIYQNTDEPEKPTNGSEAPLSSQRVQREARLYPRLETWLQGEEYRTKDISSNRSLGKWGNPDVAGISTNSSFSGTSIEIVTIEAKISHENFEQWIFEAVSHRRFANRSYFAFAHPEEAIAKIPKDMRYYAELFGIGVLVIAMDNQKFSELQNGRLDTQIETEDASVIEIFSAPYHFVQPKYQSKFCSALGIDELGDLFTWGSRGNY